MLAVDTSILVYASRRDLPFHDHAAATLRTGAVWLSEGADHLSLLRQLAIDGQITGPRIHDARIAASCLANGVSELLNVDRDFSRFPALLVRNPLVRSPKKTN